MHTTSGATVHFADDTVHSQCHPLRKCHVKKQGQKPGQKQESAHPNGVHQQADQKECSETITHWAKARATTPRAERSGIQAISSPWAAATSGWRRDQEELCNAQHLLDDFERSRIGI
jgi:hypothetical protein